MTDEQLGELDSAAALLRGAKARIEAVGEALNNEQKDFANASLDDVSATIERALTDLAEVTARERSGANQDASTGPSAPAGRPSSTGMGDGASTNSAGS